MAGAIMNKVWDFLGMDNTAEDEEIDDRAYDYEYDDDIEDEIEEKRLFGKRNKVVNMPQTQQIKMVISQPTSFEQSEEICNYLKDRWTYSKNI